jgi:C1A family cysteine protease
VEDDNDAAKERSVTITSLDTVQTAIKAKTAKWEARETGFSSAQGAELGSLLGLFFEEDTRQLLVTASRAAQDFKDQVLPGKVDWRSEREQNCVSPVRSQGACLSCVSFAVVAAMESAIVIQTANVVDLSEADLYFCSGRSCSSGWDPALALNEAKSRGVGFESDFPYTGFDQVCKQAVPRFKVSHWRVLTSRAQRQAAIAEDGPIVGCMKIFEDFRFYSSGVYEHVSGAELGLHAVCIVGYDDDDGCWIVKNSWSDKFGENGFFRIKYGQCCIDDAFPSFAFSVEALGNRDDP